MVKPLRLRGLWPGRGGLLAGVELGLRGERIASVASCAAAGADGYAMPAFVDAHWHMSWAGLEATSLLCDRLRSCDELLATLGAAVGPHRAAHGARVLRGEQLDESGWQDARLPTLAEVDRVTGETPVFLRRVCGHLAVVNSALLALLPDELAAPARRTGILRERPVLDFDRLLPASADELRAALRRAADRALAEGVTALCTMEPMRPARELGAVELPVEPRVAVFADDLPDLEEACRNRRRARAPWLFGVKIFLDGAIGARTAALRRPFVDGSEPELLYDDAALAALLARVWRLELTPVAHAIGARAIEQFLRVSRAAAREAPAAARLGVRIEHAEEAGAVASALWDPALHRLCMQPNFVRRWQQPGGLYEQRVGSAVARGLNPFGQVRRLGLALGFGSDGMPFGPRWGIAGATDHPLVSERVSRIDALRCYTLEAAAMSGLPELARPIEPGRRADLVVLADDPLAVSDLAQARLTKVLVRGRVVWEA